MPLVRLAGPTAGGAIARLDTLPFSLIATLTACAPAKPPIPVEATLVGGECRVVIEGRSLTIEEIGASARQWRGRRQSLKTDRDVPYRCIGGAIFALQRAGAARVGFIAEPPPEEGRKRDGESTAPDAPSAQRKTPCAEARALHLCGAAPTSPLLTSPATGSDGGATRLPPLPFKPFGH